MQDGDFGSSQVLDRSKAPSWQRRRGVRPGPVGCQWKRYAAPSSTFTSLWVKESSSAAATIHVPIPGVHAWTVAVDSAGWSLAGTGKLNQPRGSLNTVNLVVVDVARSPKASENDRVDDALRLTLRSNALGRSEGTDYLPLASAALQEVYSGGSVEATPGDFLGAARITCSPIVEDVAGERAVALKVVVVLRSIRPDLQLKLLVQVSPVITNVFNRPLSAVQVIDRDFARRPGEANVVDDETPRLSASAGLDMES